MDQTALHQAHAVKLLSDAGANLIGDTAADPDPQLANAQAAQEAQNRLIMAKAAPIAPADAIAAANPMPGAADPTQSFLAQQNAQPPPATPDPVAPVAPADPYAGLPAGIITGPQDLAVHAVKLKNQTVANANRDAANAEKIARETGEVDKQQAAAERPIIDSMAKQSQESYDRIQKVNADVAQQTEAKIAHFQAVQEEMSNMAKEKPQDLLGQAGVNSLLGNIAIMIGGLGSNGFHENKALQTFTAMADRNVAAQKNKFEMLNRVGQGDQTLFGMLQSKLQNTTTVEAALRGAYMDAATAHLKAAAGQFADKRTSLKTASVIEKMQKWKHQQSMVAEHQFTQDGAQAVQLADTQLGQRLAAEAAAHKVALDDAKFGLDMDKEKYKREETIKNTSFLGLIGTSSAAEHKPLASTWGGARNMISNLDEAQKLMMADKNATNARAFVALKNINLGEAKKFFNTGARLEPKEVSMMESVGMSWPQYCESMLNGGQGLTGTQIAQGLKVTQMLIARNAFGTLQSGFPNLQWDPKDPVMGRFAPGGSLSVGDYEKQAVANYGPEAGRGEVNALPAYGTETSDALGSTLGSMSSLRGGM